MANRKIELTEFEQAMVEIMNDYKEKAREACAEALPKVGQDTVRELQSTSPKRTGAYTKGWAYQMDPRKKTKDKQKMVVYNKDHYRLTHLLEKGHAKVSGGRVEAQPHIAPAAEKAEQEALKLIKNKLERIR